MKTENKLRQLADTQMWWVAQNGNQLDIHCQVVPEGEKAREVIIISNVPLEAANLIVTEHNKSLLARNHYLSQHSTI